MMIHARRVWWSVVAGVLGIASAATGAPPGPFADAGELLDALEKAGDEIRTFDALVRYEKVFVLQGDVHVRSGELYYLDERDASGEGRRAFAVVFNRLTEGRAGGAVRHAIDERLIFDGRYLVEKNERERQFIRRELAAPGERIDPLRIGEGPIVIPIGQRRAEIEQRFEVTMLPPGEGVDDEHAGWTKGTYQLRLVPREAYADEIEFREVRLWYRAQDLMPRLAHTVAHSGDESWVGLVVVAVNVAGFDRSRLSVDPPPADAGWDVQEIPRDRARAGGAG